MKKGAAITAAHVEAAVREFHGNLAAAGRRLGISRTAVLKRCQANKALQAVRDECREAMKDNAESSLHKALLAGEAWAVCFYLKTQAKDRGYVERQEVTGPGAGPVTLHVVEEIVDAPADPDADGPPAPGPAGVPPQ